MARKGRTELTMTLNHSEPATERLGAKIRRLRIERKLGQDRLAIEARTDQSGLSKFERGVEKRLSEATLRRIANVLELSYEDLLAGTEFQEVAQRL